MPIDLIPIADFDGSSVTEDQRFVVQDEDGPTIAKYVDGGWVHAETDDPIEPVAFELINPFVAPAEAEDDAASKEEELF